MFCLHHKSVSLVQRRPCDQTRFLKLKCDSIEHFIIFNQTSNYFGEYLKQCGNSINIFVFLIHKILYNNLFLNN